MTFAGNLPLFRKNRSRLADHTVAAQEKAARDASDSDDAWGDWTGSAPPASATGGVDTADLPNWHCT
eukprot:441789-Amphidinium_carterae.1